MKMRFIICIILILGFYEQQAISQKLDIWVIKCPIDKSLVCRIKNLDTISYYIPNDSWLSDFGDTLFVESIFKQKTSDDTLIHYFQFNPPQMDEIKPNAVITKRIMYKNLTLKLLPILAIRIYTRKIPYDPEKDNLKYHSYRSFLEFEKENSILIKVKIENIETILKW
jgi:hypothetical protein